MGFLFIHRVLLLKTFGILRSSEMPIINCCFSIWDGKRDSKTESYHRVNLQSGSPEKKMARTHIALLHFWWDR